MKGCEEAISIYKDITLKKFDHKKITTTLKEINKDFNKSN